MPAQLAVVEIPKSKKARKARGRYGDGRLYQRGNTWWIQYYVNGQQIRESAGSNSKEVAKAKLHEKLVAAQNGEVPTTKHTYEQFRDALYDDYEAQGHKSLFHRKDGTRYLGPVPALDKFFEGWKVTQINKAAMQDFIRARRAAGVSNSNINHALRLLRRMFWLAVEDDRKFPMSLVPHFPMLDADDAREDYLTAEQFDKVLAELPAAVRPVAIVAFNSGARCTRILAEIQPEYDQRIRAEERPACAGFPHRVA